MAERANNKLSWGLVIATYKRREVLPRCLRLALTQTRRPVEMIVVDSSPDWENTRAEVLKVCGDVLPARWLYVQAERRSSAAQRNQGLRLAAADVVFLIDDDSLLYPDCARQVMKVYEADPAGAIAGVSPIRVDAPPDEPAPSAPVTPTPGTPAKPVNRLPPLTDWLYDATGHFVPYDGRYPRRALPSAVEALGATRVDFMPGFKMTFRRKMLLEEGGFSDVMEGYTAPEDLDVSYRVSRHGALVQSVHAKLCHVAAPGGRITRYTKSLLTCMNVGVLLATHGPPSTRPGLRYRLFLLKRFFLDLAADIARRRWSLPQVRGVCFAFRQAGAIFAKTPADLKSWYLKLQRELLANDAQRQSLS